MDEFEKWQKLFGEIVDITEHKGEAHFVMSKESGLSYTPVAYHFKRFGESVARQAIAGERARIESILQDRYAELSELLATDLSDICCDQYEAGQKETTRLLKLIRKGK